VHSLVLSGLTATIFRFKCRHFNVLWWCNYGVFTMGAASRSDARGGLCVPSSKTSSFVNYVNSRGIYVSAMPRPICHNKQPPFNAIDFA
jgi:hypothetical protein